MKLMKRHLRLYGSLLVSVRGIVRLLLSAAICVLFTAGLHAQGTAGIDGTVSDSTGAIVVGATLTLNSTTQTGFTRTTTSNSDGLYTLTFLLPGTYTLTASKAGFQDFTVPQFTLVVEQRARVNLTLVVAGVNQQIDVTAQAPLLQTENAEVGEVIDEHRIVDMPLNGRQFLQLALLSSDVVQSQGGYVQGGGTQGPTLNIDGGQQDQNYFSIDGIIATQAGGNALAISPNVDALEEFQVLTNLASIQWGGYGGGYVNIVTRSGTDTFHGAGFEYVRNNILNAHNFFDAPNSSVPPYKQNQFGANVGGPIHKGSTYFFGSYEGLRVRQTQTALATVPTIAMRGGDFSACVNPAVGCKVPINPATGVAFPNNMIPTTSMDKAALSLLSLYPLPTNTNNNVLAGNFLGEPVAPTRSDNFTVRVDHKLTEKDSLFARFLYLNRSDLAPTSNGSSISSPGISTQGLPGFGSLTATQEKNFALGYTRVISPTTVLQISAGWNRPTSVASLYAPGAGTENYGVVTGIQGLTTNPAQFGPPSATIGGFSTLGGGSGGGYRAMDSELRANITKTYGKHNIQFGGNYIRRQWNPIVSSGRGSFNFTGFDTGDAFADFLLGIPATAANQTGNTTITHWRSQGYGLYVSDSWHVTPNLTLDFGLRNDFQAPWEEINGREQTINLNPLEIIVPGTTANPTGLAWMDQPLLPFIKSQLPIVGAESVGDPDSLMVSHHHNIEPRFGFSWSPFSNHATVVRGGYGIYTDFLPAWHTGIMAFAPFNVTISANNTTAKLPLETSLTNAVGGILGVADNVNFPEPYLQDWNLSVQHSLSPGLVVEVTYNGSKGTHLSTADYFNQPAVLGNNATRPFPLFAAGSVIINGFAGSFYEGGTVRVEKRLSDGITFTALYTHSKILDYDSITSGTNGTALDQSNVKAMERGPGTYDIPNRFVANYLWQLPFGPDRKFGPKSGVAGRLVGDWDFNGIVTIQTGEPFTVNESGNECGTFIAQCRPDQIGNPNLPRGQRTVQQWFNIAAFAIQSTPRYGTAGRDTVREPGLTNFDLSLAKNTRIGERYIFRFQVDAFDAFIGGRLGHHRRFNELLKGKILATDVHRFVDKLLRVYQSQKQGDETFADFTDRVPKEQILAALDWK